MLLKIGTRGSQLALKQTESIIALLTEHFPEIKTRTVIIKTTGDKFSTTPLDKIPGKGHFIKEIEAALLEGEIDLAVHSLKDLPTELAPGLVLGAVPPRLEPADALITRTGKTLEQLPAGSTVGTSSLRRQGQLLAIRPDLKVIPLRGNLDTRLYKLRQGIVDAIIVAVAGLERLGMMGIKIERLPYCVMLPAPGQGALAIEIRQGELEELMTAINHYPSYAEAQAERSLLRHLGGGCQTPIACLARAGENGELYLEAMVCYPDGTHKLSAFMSGSIHQPEELGKKLAEKLIAGGAGEIIQRLRDEDS